MIQVAEQLDAVEAYAAFYQFHTAAISPVTPSLESMVHSVAVMQKCLCRWRLLQPSYTVEHVLPSPHAPPAWHLPPRSNSTVRESLYHQSLLLALLHYL